MADNVSFSVRLDPDRHAKLRKFADAHRWSLNTAIQYLIDGIEFKDSADEARAAERGDVR